MGGFSNDYNLVFFVGKEELSMTGKPVILSGHKVEYFLFHDLFVLLLKFSPQEASCTRQVTLRYNRVVICTSTQQCKKLFEECE